MHYWAELKELFACMGVIILFGMTLGLWVMYEGDGRYSKENPIAYEHLEGVRETGKLQDDNRSDLKLATAIKDGGQ